MTKDAKESTNQKEAKAQPRTEFFQMRMREYDKGKLKMNADRYAGGDMTLWAEYCFENAPRKHLVKK